MMENDRFIPLARPYVGSEELDAVRRVLASRHLAQGPEVAALEVEVSAILDGAGVVAVSSGGAALLAALTALEIGPGAEVVVPVFAFPAAAQATFFLGAVPVPADVDPDTMAVTAGTIERVLTPRTRAVVVVHAFGIPACIEDIAALCRSRGLRLIEDAACSLGGKTWTGAPSGTIADIGCFSMHPRKPATSGEGGLLTARDPTILARLRRFRDYGRTGGGPGDAFGEIGLNLRLGDVPAAIGRVQIGRLKGSIRLRGLLADRYRRQFDSKPGMSVPSGYLRPGQTWQTFVVRLDRPADQVRRSLADDGIQAGVTAHALTSQTFFRHRCPDVPACPVGEDLAMTTLALPLFDEMTRAQVDRVGDRLLALLAD
jgi:dTDP-4-amino-4,6-dideoxygalactose transaminase